MDFIEKILGIAPDGGSGSLEFLLFAVPICGIVWLALSRTLNRKPARWSGFHN